MMTHCFVPLRSLFVLSSQALYFSRSSAVFRMYNLTVIFSIFRFGIVHKNALLGFGKQRDNVHSFFN